MTDHPHQWVLVNPQGQAEAAITGEAAISKTNAMQMFFPSPGERVDAFCSGYRVQTGTFADQLWQQALYDDVKRRYPHVKVTKPSPR